MSKCSRCQNDFTPLIKNNASPEKENYFFIFMLWLWSKNFINAPLITTIVAAASDWRRFMERSRCLPTVCHYQKSNIIKSQASSKVKHVCHHCNDTHVWLLMMSGQKSEPAKWGWLGPSKMSNWRNPHFADFIIRLKPAKWGWLYTNIPGPPSAKGPLMMTLRFQNQLVA